MLLRRACLALVLVSASSAALAAGATSDFDVIVNLTNKCTVDADQIDFGTTDDLGVAIASTGTVNVTCTQKGGAYSVTFNVGQGSGATAAARKMTTTGGDTINYGLYSDAARTQILGNGTSGTVAFTGDSSVNRNVNYTIYAQIPGGQNGKTVGTYTDTVRATLTY